jgi:hypothetical protein
MSIVQAHRPRRDNIVTSLSESRRSFGLEIGFFDQFNTLFVNTFNCSAKADFYTFKIATANAKSSQSAMSSPIIPW